MKRFIPLMITAVFGFLLIAAFFSPYTEGLGEGVAIWFDILAAIAFILGGGNLLKVHLKKISDRPAGWGYSVITVLAFLVTLFIGFSKWGVSPAPKQEEFGRTIAGLPLEEFTLVYTVEGRIPSRPDGKRLPPSVRWQMDQHRGKIRFRGWMSAHQKAELIDYKQQLKWQCAVEKLFEEAQPPGSLKDKVQYHADHEVLSFTGLMTEEDRDLLRELGQSEAWSRAVDELYEKTQTETQVALDFVPEGFDAERARQVSEHIRYDAAAKTLAVRGPMSRDQRDALARQFPVARPLSLQRCGLLLSELTDRGPLSDKQVAAFHRAVATWKVEQLHKALDRAGEAEEVERSYSAMLRDQEARIANIEAKELGEAEPPLTDRQVEILHQFVENREWTTGRLVREFEIAPLGPRQTRALEAFLQRQPTAGRRKYDLWHKLLKAGPLTGQQQDYLLADYRNQTRWEENIDQLFSAAHTVKYPWSGEYNAQGAPFWWAYEYAFKPLTATMFAMLAFYVASAAFRAFRAKNIEAILLLGTAFIILLGRTFAGVVATAWLPDWLSGLRIENLTVTIMSVFNTAGTRAIFIGIALGIASTSLKVLLGIDRSYLGSGEE